MHSNTASPTATRPFTLRRATDGDLDGVLALLAETAGWLNGRGVRQWPADGFPAGRITPLIDEGVLYLLDRADGQSGPVATLALDGHADPEFWDRGDDPGSALYVHKLAVARDHAGTGLGRRSSTGRACGSCPWGKDGSGLTAPRTTRGCRTTIGDSVSRISARSTCRIAPPVPCSSGRGPARSHVRPRAALLGSAGVVRPRACLNHGDPRTKSSDSLQS